MGILKPYYLYYKSFSTFSNMDKDILHLIFQYFPPRWKILLRALDCDGKWWNIVENHVFSTIFWTLDVQKLWGTEAQHPMLKWLKMFCVSWCRTSDDSNKTKFCDQKFFARPLFKFTVQCRKSYGHDFYFRR